MTLTPVQLFDLAERFANGGQVAEAATMFRLLAGNRDRDVRAEARFRLGNLLQNTGDLDGAAQAYRDLLDEKPSATAVRLQLAYLLAKMGQEDAARGQIRRASTAGLPEDVARAVDRFQLALRSRRRLGAGLEIGIAPDSNINRANGNSTVDIGSTAVGLSPDAQAQSGLGFAIAPLAFWRPRVTANTNLLFNLVGKADLYGKSQFNDVSLSFDAGPEVLHGRSRVRPAVILGRRWFGGKAYAQNYGVALNWLRQLDRTSQIQLDLTAVQNDYRINSALTGRATSVVARYERALSPRLFARVLGRVDRQQARDPAFATWSTGGELLMSRELRRMTVYGRAGYYKTWGDASFSIFPARRRDDLIDLEAGLILRKLSAGGLAPVIRIHRTQNKSPVFFYDFQRTRVEFGVTRDF